MNTFTHSYSLPAKFIHMGLAVFGILAYLTAEGAEHNDGGFEYLLHAYLGLTLMAFVLFRVVGGFAGSQKMRFSNCSPFSRLQWTQSIEDIKGLTKFSMPERGMHEGLAGLVQIFGLI
ncbi:MAG: cytochrome b/b6 domain-containing protein, partial [Gammaproteobacteria bacterium]|nr:cytochrome b/b6 domain-containing protein [Gammaproteobacteria bacterium]